MDKTQTDQVMISQITFQLPLTESYAKFSKITVFDSSSYEYRPTCYKNGTTPLIFDSGGFLMKQYKLFSGFFLVIK
jgi:hypothetical protein